MIVASDRLHALPAERREAEDASGRKAIHLITEAGHALADYFLVPNDAAAIKEALGAAKGSIAITIGGTGISRKDITVDAIKPLFSRELPGFGELFRSMTHRRGGAAMLSRACAGVCGNKIVFCLPGAPDAVELALKQLILPQAGHAVFHAFG